jgi:outer membrane protein OmpA-like peptidoglycan-associated protein
MALRVSAQKQAANPCALLQNKNDVCALFACYAEQGRPQDAYGLHVKGLTRECKDCGYLVHVPGVLAANREFDAAEIAIHTMQAACPDADGYETEMDKLRSLREMSKNPKPIDIALSRANSTDANDLLGWIMGDQVIPISDQRSYTSHFPVSRTTLPRFKPRIQERPIKNRQLHKICSQLDAQEYLHIGPGQLVNDSILFFTAVPGGPFSISNQGGKLKLYTMNLYGNVSTPSEMDICAAGYNDAYPAYDAARKTLVFSSDRPGGQGGMDLWECRFENNQWTEPTPLGPKINSQWDELFPHLLADTLYLASNRTDMGFGGLDLYATHRFHQALINLGSPVNSPYHDYMLVFTSSEEAHFVSDRPSVLKGDNIYTMHREEKKLFFDVISGGDESLARAAGSTVLLIDKTTMNQHTAVIGADGRFHFHNVKGMSNFELQFPDVDFAKGDKISLYNADGNVIKELVSNGTKSFHFELLTPLDYYLSHKESGDRVAMNSSLISRMLGLGGDTPRQFGLELYDSAGNLIGVTYTAADGSVQFTPVQGTTQVAVVCQVAHAGQAIHLYNELGQSIAHFVGGSGDVAAAITLPPGTTSVSFMGEPEFQHMQAGLRQLAQTVYFDYNSSQPTSTSLGAVDKVRTLLLEHPSLTLEINGHTDSRGSGPYNMALSARRANTVKQLLLQAGINPMRLKVVARGESQLLNACADGVSCSEDEHALNRRVELHFSGYIHRPAAESTPLTRLSW